jgi:hypothetical protein
MSNLSINHKFHNIDQIQLFNEFNGYHFFSTGAKGFFDSKIYNTIYRNRFFVTSEKYPHGSRKYSIRMIKTDGSIETLGDFNSFATKNQASRFIMHNLTFEHSKIIDLLSKAFNTGKFIHMLARFKKNYPEQWGDISKLELVSSWLIEWAEAKIGEL